MTTKKSKVKKPKASEVPVSKDTSVEDYTKSVQEITQQLADFCSGKKLGMLLPALLEVSLEVIKLLKKEVGEDKEKFIAYYRVVTSFIMEVFKV